MNRSILIRLEHGASYWIYNGIGNAFKKLGWGVYYWWGHEDTPLFELFDTVRPGLFLFQSYNLKHDVDIPSVLRCYENTICFVKCGIWGNARKCNYEKYPVLIADDEEKERLGNIPNKDRLYLFNYCSDRYVDDLLCGWYKQGYSVFGLLPAADTTIYSRDSEKLDVYDVVFVGGYWDYKAINLKKYMFKLCFPIAKYKVVIFGNNPWPLPQYLGTVDEQTAINYLKLSTVGLNISEPHAVDLGYEVNERTFKLAAMGLPVLTDRVQSLETDVWGDAAVYYDNRVDFLKKINLLLKDEKLRKNIADKCYELCIQKHTYVHRVKSMLSEVGLYV